MLTLPSARVENIFPAIPTMCRICRPTRDKIAMSLETVICSAKIEDQRAVDCGVIQSALTCPIFSRSRTRRSSLSFLIKSCRAMETYDVVEGFINN